MTWFTEQRNRFIRLTLENTGRINTTHLIEKFGVTKVTAAQDLVTYVDENRENLSYDSKERVWKLLDWPKVYV